MDQLNIFLTIIAAALTTVSAVKWKSLNWRAKTPLVLSILATVVGGVINYKAVQKNKLVEQINASYGSMTPTFNIEYPVIAIGFHEDSASFVKYSNPGIFEFFNEPLAKVYVHNGKLFFSSVIRDSTGDPILAISENEWTKYSDDYEFNNDENGLELVTKGDREVFFHMKFSKGTVYMEGVLWTKEGKGVNLFGGQPGEQWNGMQILGKGTGIDNSKCKRLFKYPRERYLGQREL